MHCHSHSRCLAVCYLLARAETRHRGASFDCWLGSQIQTESSTASQVKKSVSGFLTHVQKAFTPDTMQDDDTEAYVLRDGQPVLLDRLQVRGVGWL